MRAVVDALPTYVPGRSSAAAGTLLTQLASNESPFPPLPSVVAAIAEEATRVHRYPAVGSPLLTAALAERCEVDPAQVAVGAGSVCVMAQLATAVLEPGLSAVYPWRSFEAYPLLVQVTGAEALPVPLADQSLDLPALVAAVRPDTRLLLLCSPNNPTGTLLEPAAVEQLLADVPPTCLVVLDEAYLDYVDPGAKPPALRWLAEHDNLVLLRTFSKAHGLAGLRVGYSLSSPEVARAVTKVAMPFTVTALAERAAVVSLSATAELADRVAFVRAERTRVEDGLVELGFAPTPSQGNFTWLADPSRPAGLADRLSGSDVLARHFPEGTRVTIGTAQENDRFLAAMALQ